MKKVTSLGFISLFILWWTGMAKRPFILKMKVFCCVAQVGPELLGSSDPPPRPPA